MSKSLHQPTKKQDDLSCYIKKQLSTLLKQVQQTPPKRSSSLKNISQLVQKSHIPKFDKRQIEKQIKRVQTAIQRSSSVHNIKLKLRNQPKVKDKYQKSLFYEKLILQQKQLNLKSKILNQPHQSTKKKSKHQFLNLIETFQQLRTQRLKYQHDIQNLAIKAQKLQRLIELKKQNEQKYLQSVIISQKYHQKKQRLQNIRKEVKSAAKQNRKHMIGVLMKKYSEVQQM